MTTLTKDSKANLLIVKQLTNTLYPDNEILADLTIAQAILEGGLLNSPPSQLAYQYNNLFGIKGIGTNGQVNLSTHEYYPKDGIVIVDQYFAVNNSIEDSLQQHKELLEHPRYSSVLNANSFEQAAIQVWHDGYATDPNYPNELMNIWENYVRNN